MRLLLLLQITLFIITSHTLYSCQKLDQSKPAMPFLLLLNSCYKNYKDHIIICPVGHSIYKDPLIYEGNNSERDYSEDNLLAFTKNGIDSIQKYIEKQNRRVFIFANCCKNDKQTPDRNSILVYEKQYSSKKCRKPTMKTQVKDYQAIKQLINNTSLIIYNIPWHDRDFCLHNHINHIHEELTQYRVPLLILIDDHLFRAHKTKIESMVTTRDQFKSKKIMSYNPNSDEIKRYVHQDTYLKQRACIFLSGFCFFLVLRCCNII